jgi:UDP-GlcNAc:undecaprenyl-phosphate GlcNAc-1-phosphate transferase
VIIIWGLATAIISLVLTWWIRGYCLSHKLALAPIRKRDQHRTPTPRIGGVAIVASFVAVMIVLAIFLPKETTDFGFPFSVFGVSIDKRLLGILVASIFLSAVMLFDDLKGIPAYLKLAAQIISALILIGAGVGLIYINNPFGLTIYLDSWKIPFQIGTSLYHIVIWADLLFVFWIILLTNATNFIDGLDGLAPTLSLIAAVILAFLSLKIGQPATALLAAVFAGAIAGFLPWNLPRAKIFLGDTGSMFLGLMLAVLTVISGGKLATVLLVFGLVILDAIYVIGKRIVRGKNSLTTPDRSHLHHRFLDAGFTPASNLISISAISLLFGLAGVFVEGRMKIYLIGVLAVITLIIFVLLDLARRRKSAN